MEHRSSTRARHLTLFCAVPLSSFHVKCFLFYSAILVRCQVCRGLPFFRFPLWVPLAGAVQMSRQTESRAQTVISSAETINQLRLSLLILGKSGIENCPIKSHQSLPHLVDGVVVRNTTATKFARLKMPLVSSVENEDIFKVFVVALPPQQRKYTVVKARTSWRAGRWERSFTPWRNFDQRGWLDSPTRS